MWKTTIVVALTLLVVTSTAAGTIPVADTTSSKEAPLADAGLDQEVTKGTTVLLDGSGSRDPDGRIDRYNWSIRTPSDEIITPECSNCAQTEFAPSELGRYRVTLTVTDDDGATSSDTLFVDVSPGTEPSISLSGPQQPTEGDTATYTANLDAGTSALEHVVWSVDGTVIANHSLSADQNDDAVTKRFPTAGDRTVSATLYDADGQSDTDSLSVTVQPEDQTDDPSDPSLADQYSPTVTGDAVVTGTKPLRGQYQTQLEASPTEVMSIEWHNATGPISSGKSLSRTWEPGDHDLFAVVSYDDGSENVATFDDGSTTVVADPRPNASFGMLDRYGSISGTVTGLDEYGNLDSLRVEVDGQTVARSSSSLRDRHRLDDGRRRTVQFSNDEFTPGESHSVTVVAVDERGQTSEVTRDIIPVKEPEIVRSEFVNTPVDSYHERLDPERYAAHHVLEIDLNGVDREDINVVIEGGQRVRSINEKQYVEERRYIEQGNRLLVETFWRGPEPGTYEIDAGYQVEDEDVTWWAEKTSGFKVIPSRPELRLDILNDGTKDYITREHGILVNANGSFDPDGTELKYIWKYGANPTKPDNTTAKFQAYERAASIVEDGYELRAKEEFDFLSYFVPGIERRTILTDEPYFPNETVRVRVETEAYHFSKPTYYDDFALGLTVSNPQAEVLEWYQTEATNSGHSDATEDPYRYVGIVEVPASELITDSGAPTITVYNEDNERKTTESDYPNVNVLLKDRTYWTNANVRNLTYTVEKPDIREVTAASEDRRDEYLEDGYSVDATQNQTKYFLEKRVKVQDAEYEQVTKDFQSDTIRELFLNSYSDWYATGTIQKEVTKTKTNSGWYDAATADSRSEWHDSNLENGEYTGKSRQVVVEPAIYRTEQKYRYTYEVEKTGTRTVTRTRSRKVPRTGTRTVTHCTVKFGCTTTTETYTYYTTQTYSYTTTETYTYTVSRTGTYWSQSIRDSSHEFTGDTRKIQIQEEVYETQYEIETKTQYTETVTRYEASHDELVEPAQYEWTEEQSTTDSMLARKQTASNENWRIGESVTNTTWVLTKQNGTVRTETSYYKNESHVVETSATVKGDRVEQYYNSETGEKVTKEVEEKSKQYTSDGAKNRQEIIDEVTDSDENDDECKLKGTC
jgi:hypothetical protein